MLTATQIAHAGSGYEPPKFELSQIEDGHCACCGAAINGDAVHIKEIENPTFSNHADFLRWGKYVCPACAWLYGAGKGKPGNFLATPDKYETLVISLDSVVEDKRPWLSAIYDLAKLPPDTPVCGILTTDIKPRLFPRMVSGTAAKPNIFVHAGDYDISQPVQFDLQDLLQIIDVVLSALQLGFSKTNCYRGLFNDFNKFSKNVEQAYAIEQQLAQWRGNPAFIPAVLISGISKGKTKDEQSQRPTLDIEPIGTGSGADYPYSPGLF